MASVSSRSRRARSQPERRRSRALRRQQLGRHGRRDQAGRNVEPADVHARGAAQHHSRHPGADGRDRHRPRPARLLPRDPSARRRGPRPVRRRHVRLAGRPAAGRLAAEPRRRRRTRPQHRRDRLALPRRRPALRPHGDVPRRQARRRLGLDRQRRPHPRHVHGPGGRQVRLGRLAAREQLLRRRPADLPRQHRARLHAGRPAAARLDEGRSPLPDRRREHQPDRQAARHGPEARGGRLPEHELRGAADGAHARTRPRSTSRSRSSTASSSTTSPRTGSPASPTCRTRSRDSRARSTCSTPRTTASP